MVFQRLNSGKVNEENLEFWEQLFTSVKPDTQFPDLAQIITTQKSNVMHICQLCTDYLESTWLNLEDFSEILIENSLVMLAAIIPITIEHNFYEFFWDQRLLAYRLSKAACGLFVIRNSRGFESSRRQSLIIKMFLACMVETNFSWKMLFTKELVNCETFVFELIDVIGSKGKGNTENILNVVKILDALINVKESEDFHEFDMNVIKSLMAERKSTSGNKVKFVISRLTDETLFKLLDSLRNACKVLEGTNGVEYLIVLISSLFKVIPEFCKYIALTPHYSIVSSAISSNLFSNYRFSGVHFTSFFFALSHYREFSISLSSSEANTLFQTICSLILIPDYEFQQYFPLLFGTICNLLAYTLQIDQNSSESLISAFEYITNKSWLIEKEKNCYNIFYIVQAFTNAIQYQWEGCGHLVYLMVKKRESFYKVIRMQMNTADEANLDDEDTEGEQEFDEARSAEGSQSGEIFEVDEEEKLSKRDSKQSSKRKYSENSPASEEEGESEEDDRVADLERISEGLMLDLNRDSPEEIVRKTSYLNTHVSNYSDDPERRNTIQHAQVELAKDEEWKPTPEWMLIWKTKLPMKVIFIAIKETFSLVMKMQEERKSFDEIAKAITEYTLVGLLPRPDPVYLVHEKDL